MFGVTISPVLPESMLFVWVLRAVTADLKLQEGRKLPGPFCQGLISLWSLSFGVRQVEMKMDHYPNSWESTGLWFYTAI